MNLKCVFNIHEPELAYNDTSGSIVMFQFFICKKCNKRKVDCIGGGGMKHGHWKKEFEAECSCPYYKQIMDYNLNRFMKKINERQFPNGVKL